MTEKLFIHTEIHPEPRAMAIKELRALADQLEAGDNPMIAIGYRDEWGRGNHWLLTRHYHSHLSMLTLMQHLCCAMLLPDGAVKTWDPEPVAKPTLFADESGADE